MCCCSRIAACAASRLRKATRASDLARAGPPGGTGGRHAAFRAWSLHALSNAFVRTALQERRGIVDGLLDELDAMAPVFEAPDWRPFQPGYRLQRAVAHAHAAIARRDFVAASTHLDTAAACNAPAHPNRESLNVDVLRAVVAHKRREPDAPAPAGRSAQPRRLGGCHRLLAEAHPLALALDRQLEPDDATAPPPPRRPRRLALRGGLLTAKESGDPWRCWIAA
jgi:hypothetical protein